eukprot:CCRYP_000749-RA/>CCRYP_000749-RA protein AED:0.02 eAED:0.02 QI:387/1/1/1/1/1/3/1737/1030
MHTGTMIELTKHEKGSKVLYKSRGSLLEEASILAVHVDDALEPFYTIRLHKDGREKQTDNAHIIPFSKEYQDSSSSIAVRVNRGTHRKSNRSYPVRQRIHSRHSCSQDDGYCSNNQPSGSDHPEDQTRIALATRQQALPTSILRPSSYGPIRRTDLTDTNETNDVDNRHDKESAHSKVLGEISKSKYGIFNRIRSYMSSFQSKTDRIQRTIKRSIYADDPPSTDDLDETVHELEESITLNFFGAEGCPRTALSDPIEATIAHTSQKIGAPKYQRDEARSQIANTRFVFNENKSVPSRSVAPHAQEALSDEIQDKAIQNLRPLSKKRRIDHENEWCDHPPYKRARYTVGDNSSVSIQKDMNNFSSRIGTRAYHRKNRCLYRPRIDKRYFERKHKKKDRVNLLSQVNRLSYPLQDHTIDMSISSNGNDGLYGSDCYDVTLTRPFHSQSDLFTEISSKARRLRLKGQNQTPEKIGAELCSAPKSHTAGQAETKNANTALLEPDQKTKRSKDRITPTAGNKGFDDVKTSPPNEKRTIGSATTHYSVGEAKTNHANTPVILERQHETKSSDEIVTQAAGHRCDEANEKTTLGKMIDYKTDNQISRNLLHKEPTRKQRATFKYTQTESSYASDKIEASSTNTEDDCPQRRRHKPMVTFAPKRISRGTNSYLLRPNANHMFSPPEMLSTMKSESSFDGLPFDFMPRENEYESNAPAAHISTTGVFSTVKTYAIDLIVKLWRLWIESMTFRSTTSTQSQDLEDNEGKNSKPIAQHRSSRFILPKNFDRHPKGDLSKRTVLATPKPGERSNKELLGYVKNPKGLLPPVPFGWDSMFVLKPGEWRCRLCNFKNPVHAMACDCCMAVKVGEDLPTKHHQADEVDSPDQWRCHSCSSKNPSCAMSCDSCTAVKVNRTVLANGGGDVSALTDHETYSTSLENRPVKRSDPAESTVAGSGNSKRSKGPDVAQHQTKQTNGADKGISEKKHSIGAIDDDSNTKRISLEHGKNEATRVHEQHDAEDVMDIEMIPDSPNDRDENMSE